MVVMPVSDRSKNKRNLRLKVNFLLLFIALSPEKNIFIQCTLLSIQYLLRKIWYIPALIQIKQRAKKEKTTNLQRVSVAKVQFRGFSYLGRKPVQLNQVCCQEASQLSLVQLRQELELQQKPPSLLLQSRHHQLGDNHNHWQDPEK